MPRRILAIWLYALAAGAIASDHGVVLLYHHVASDTPSSTSVSEQRFDEHLEYIADHGYQVWPLERLAGALRRRRAVPDKVVALTFDDAYRSVLSYAAPRLERRGWPFTVFVNTQAVDDGSASTLSWQQLGELMQAGADIGNHTRSHAHLVHRPREASIKAWRSTVRDEIESAQERIERQLGVRPSLFAYPYGEFTEDVTEIVREIGLIGFGQHSGPLGHTSDFAAAPRFPMATGFDGMQMFATKLDSRPVHVETDPPNGHVLTPHGQLRSLVTNVRTAGAGELEWSCFQGGERLPVDRLDASTIVLHPRDAGPGRTKYNCTARVPDRSGDFYWWSFLLMKPLADGGWYDG